MIRLVPAIDLIGGEAVRLQQGDFDVKTTYSKDPLALALDLQARGFGRLHLVDLDGAKQGAVSAAHLEILKRIAANTSLEIDFSGGLNSIADISAAFHAGASQVVLGSLACRAPSEFAQALKQWGGQEIILAADVKDDLIYVRGWTEKTDRNVFRFLAQWLELGVAKVMVTSIKRDGMLGGPDIGLYQRLVAEFPTMQLIASGGVSKAEDIKALDMLGAKEAIVGKALYGNQLDLTELKGFVW